MNQGIDLGSAIILTAICTLIYIGALAYRKYKDKGGRPGELTYWQDGEQHSINVGFTKKHKAKAKRK